MDKLQMAMRFAEIMLIEHFKGNGVYSRNGYKDEICEDAWVMADAMQAEADKRNKPEIHLVSIDTEVNGNKMTLEFIHTDMKAAAKSIQDLFEDKQ